MNYNQFTIEYIESIKRNFRVELNSNGDAGVAYDEISDNDIKNLKEDLERIWSSSENAIDIVRKKHDANIQSGLFGLINDFDKALKVGFLLGDRIVLIDYLFSRILLKKAPHQINRIQLGAIATSLISALPLAETGRIVIIPNPFEWYPHSKKVIEEASEKTNLTVELMSLLNMLSITKELLLHPYTIAESEEVFSEITNKQLDSLEIIGRDAGQYAYTGLLASLLSERLLTKTELKYALQVPLTRYHEVISSQKDFHNQFVSSITKLGFLNANNNIERIRKEVLDAINKNNFQSIAPVAKAITVGGSLGSAAIAVLGEVSVISAPLLITGAALSLSASLAGLINSKHNNDDPIISVFKVLSLK